MSNIQESVNSILTTGATLKTLGEKKELRKSQAEKLELEKNLLRQKIEYQENIKKKELENKANLEKKELENKENLEKKETKHKSELAINKAYIDALNEQSKLGKYENINPKFSKAQKSAYKLYKYSNDSLESFMAEYEDRSIYGGNK